MDSEGLAGLLRSQRSNAAISWGLLALVVVASAGSFLTGNLLWTFFTGSVVVLAALPALSMRNPLVMPPWEVVLFATLPVIGGLLATTIITGQLATYLSVAAVAVILAVDLDVFTPVEMNDSFAVLFVVVTTMATAGIWAVIRWIADIYLGTGFIESEHALMLEFVASTAAGVLAGLVYVFYVRRRANPELRLPEEVESR